MRCSVSERISRRAQVERARTLPFVWGVCGRGLGGHVSDVVTASLKRKAEDTSNRSESLFANVMTKWECSNRIDPVGDVD